MNKAILNEILSNYSVGEIRNFSLIPLGVSSQNWKVETSHGFFFLKKHRESGGGRIESIERMESYFNTHNIPIVSPIPTKEGKFHITYEGVVYVLYPFVEGQSFEVGKIPDDILKKMGDMLATMHLLTKSGITGTYADVSRYFMPSSPEKSIEEIDHFLSRVSKVTSKTDYDRIVENGLKLKKEMVIKYAQDIKELSFEKLNLGHGDYHPQNIFFDQSQNISAIFDLDTAGPVPRIYELVRSLMLSCFNHTYTEEKIKQAIVFMNAYFKKYPFEKKDFKKGMDAYFFKTFSVWRERAHYEEHDFRTDAEYFSTLENIKYLDTKKEDLIENLYKKII